MFKFLKLISSAISVCNDGGHREIGENSSDTGAATLWKSGLCAVNGSKTAEERPVAAVQLRLLSPISFATLFVTLHDRLKNNCSELFLCLNISVGLKETWEQFCCLLCLAFFSSFFLIWNLVYKNLSSGLTYIRLHYVATNRFSAENYFIASLQQGEYGNHVPSLKLSC